MKFLIISIALIFSFSQAFADQAETTMGSPCYPVEDTSSQANDFNTLPQSNMYLDGTFVKPFSLDNIDFSGMQEREDYALEHCPRYVSPGETISCSDNIEIEMSALSEGNIDWAFAPLKGQFKDEESTTDIVVKMRTAGWGWPTNAAGTPPANWLYHRTVAYIYVADKEDEGRIAQLTFNMNDRHHGGLKVFDQPIKDGRYAPHDMSAIGCIK